MNEKKEISGVQQLDHYPLMSNNQTISFQPNKFIIDFKGIYPQFTPDNKAQMAISHKVVLLDPHSAKDFVKMMSDNIKNYENKFGKIKTPSEITKAKSDMKKDTKKNNKKEKEDTDKKLSYMG